MRTISKLLLTMVLVLSAVQASAQAVNNVRGELDTGIQEGGYITIDGKRFVVRPDELEITYAGKPVRDTVLQEGMTVFYSTRADGSLSELTLIGPSRLLDLIGNN